MGTFGNVVFEVSSNRIRTFNDFTRSGSGRWATHEIIGYKPEPEYLGPGQEEITFSVRLDANLGVNPEEELKKLRTMRDTGALATLVIGGQPVTQNLWLLESLREQHNIYTGKGRLVTAVVELTLREYPRPRRR